MLDINFSDLVEYFSKDERTKVITLYIESLDSSGKEFMEAVKRCKKPVIVLKSGKSSSGKKAASSHVGALASDSRIYSGAFKQCSAIEANSLEEMFVLAGLLEKQGLPKGPRAVIVTNAGGPGVLLSDALELNKIQLINLNSIEQELNNVLPKTWSHNNPIDVIGDALAERYEKAFEVLLNHKDDFDIAICCLTPQDMTQPLKTARAFVDFYKKSGKFCVALFMGGNKVVNSIKYLESRGIKNFSDPEFLARTIALVAGQQS